MCLPHSTSVSLSMVKPFQLRTDIIYGFVSAVYGYNAVLMTLTLPMGSSSKISVAAGDRLSSLPDDLLHAIMSFLPVRQAVQTCVLSRRWEHLWCSMPCLNIDQREFNLTASGPKKGDQFEEFVNNLLMFHRASSLDTFRFHVTHTYGFKVVDRWIRRGMKCCPAVVEMDSSSSTLFYGLPHLGSNACRLKKLHLVAIALDKSFTQLLPSGCPLLEDLKVGRCLFDSPEIISCTLKNLIVEDCTTYCGKVLNITAPDLVSFYLVINIECNWGGILVNEMPFVANSTICLKPDSRSKSTSQRKPCKLLSSITNVKKLELSGSKTVCFSTFR